MLRESLRSHLIMMPEIEVVGEAADGEVAVMEILRTVPDCVLLDLELPVMDGYTATGHIRAWERERNGKPTIIVALTAHALKGDEQKSLAAGCNGHLTKPIKKKDFLAAIQTFMQDG